MFWVVSLAIMKIQIIQSNASRLGQHKFQLLIPSHIFSHNRHCRWTNYLTAAPTIYITQNLRPNVLIHFPFPKPFHWPTPDPGSFSVCPGSHGAGIGTGAMPGPTWPPGASSAFVPSRGCWFYTSSGPPSPSACPHQLQSARCTQSLSRRRPYTYPSGRHDYSIPVSGG